MKRFLWIEKPTMRLEGIATFETMGFRARPMPRSAQTDIVFDVFAGGAIHLHRDTTEMRLTAWPVPRAERRLGRDSQWQAFVPEFRVIQPYRPKSKTPPRNPRGTQLAFDFFDETYDPNPPVRLTPTEATRKAFDQFRFSMPKPIARILEPFRTNQWPLLIMLAYDNSSIELAQNNPALAFALAQQLKCDGELIAALKCGQMRQRDLLEILSLPSSPRAVNLFRKISPASVNGDNWHSMIQLIRRELEEKKSPLYHLPTINSGVIEILQSPEASRAASQTLLEEVSREKAERHRGRIVHIITSTLQMQDELRIQSTSRRFQNVERLKRTHAEVTDQYRRRIRQLIDANRHESHRFRNPPYPGIPGQIEPITSAEALVNEGEEQQNCVASYANRVHQGTTFIYRVLQPERATLSIVQSTPLGEWSIGELETKCNIEVQPETEEFIRNWLDRHRNLM